MRTIKTVLAAVLACGLALSAQAQIGDTGVVLSSNPTNTAMTPGSAGWTNIIAGYTSVTNMTPIDCRGKSALFLQFKGIQGSNYTASATFGPVYIWIYKSVMSPSLFISNNWQYTNCAATNTWSHYAEKLNPATAGNPPDWRITMTGVPVDAGGNLNYTVNCTNFTIANGTLYPWMYIGIISNSVGLSGYNGPLGLTNYSITARLE